MQDLAFTYPKVIRKKFKWRKYAWRTPQTPSIPQATDLQLHHCHPVKFATY